MAATKNTLFPVNTYRVDPYKNFRFKVKDVDAGAYVAGVSKVTGLKRSTQVVEYREGGDPSVVHLSPGQTKYEPITLERGVTHDQAFEQWANKIFYLPNSQKDPGQNTSLKDFRKTIRIEMYNEAGQIVLAWVVYRCWVSEFNVLSDLDGKGNDVAIQSIVLQNEGWIRDTAVTEPTEPSFTQPT